MNDSKKKRSIVWLGLVATWFGSHVGAGFATGSQYVVYYADYGWFSIFMPFVTWLIVAAAFYIIYEYCRLIKAESYKDYAKNFYLPNNKIISSLIVLLFDLWLISAQIIGLGGILAGGGSMFETSLHLPYWMGILLVGVIITLMVIFGMKVLMKVQKYMMYVLWVCIIVIGVLGLVNNIDNFKTVISTRATNRTLWEAFKGAFTYASLRMAVMGCTAPIAGTLTSSQETRKTVIFGGIINSVMLWIFGLFILSMYPEINKEALPILSGIQRLGQAYIWLEILYDVLLLFALITTGAGCCFTVSSRFGASMQKVIKSDKLCRLVIIALLMGIGAYFSSWGIYEVFSRGYGYLAKFAQPMVLFPALILGPYRIWQLRSGRGEKCNTGNADNSPGQMKL